LLHHFGLYEQGWRFKMSSAHRQMGVCKHGLKRIEFSKHFINSPWEEVRDTILHEIAHALVGPKHGHGPVWQNKCIQIGANPRRTAGVEAVNESRPNFRWKCEYPGCGFKADRFRIKRHLIDNALCPRCKAKGRKSILKAYKLTYK